MPWSAQSVASVGILIDAPCASTRLLWLNQMESAREAKLAASRRQKQKEKDRRNTSSRRDEEGGLEDRERSNLSKRQREGTSLANRSSSEHNNG